MFILIGWLGLDEMLNLLGAYPPRAVQVKPAEEINAAMQRPWVSEPLGQKKLRLE